MSKRYYCKLEDIKHEKDQMMLVSKALKEYVAKGKTSEQFEKEYGCTLILDEANYGIKDIRFHNTSNETMFMLKYSK